MHEKDLLDDIQITASKSRRCVLFRNNVGQGWVGQIVEKTPTRITLANFRPLHAGLVRGSSDLIGWTTVTITPEMVGRKIAVFTALEAKTPRDKLKPDQDNFITRVKEAGGIASEIRDAAHISGIISEFEK